MIKSFYTSVTNIAVSWFWSTNYFTCWTQHIGIKFFYKF